MSTEKFEVTLYGLFLGDQDSTTGHYRLGYVYQTITGTIQPRGGSRAYLSAGKYSTLKGVLYTNYAVEKGDVVRDAFGNYWEIEETQPWAVGDEFSHYECDLTKLMHFPFTAGLFGFEIRVGSPGAVEQGFEDGFERGYWAL